MLGMQFFRGILRRLSSHNFSMKNSEGRCAAEQVRRCFELSYIWLAIWAKTKLHLYPVNTQPCSPLPCTRISRSLSNPFNTEVPRAMNTNTIAPQRRLFPAGIASVGVADDFWSPKLA